MTALLNVTRSVTGRRWVGLSLAEERAAEHLAQTNTLPHPLCRHLARRHVLPEDVDAFLAPTLRALLPDPRTLKDMDHAAARLLQAVNRQERIAVFADYDVDGGSSAALLIWWLRFFGREARLYVPDRIDEGYGPNAPAMAELAQNHDLILCVDCGTLSHEALAAAQGADVVVLDHHLGGETLPPAFAVVNPNRQDESGDLGHLCAAAVVFLCLVEAGRQLREAGQKGPDLMSFLDLVGLATVADVAPLTGVNRAFVRQGLTVMATRSRPGLTALSDVARLDQAPSAYHLGYVLGPRVNSGGRIGAADLGARLLSTQDPHEAQALAERLDRLNTERREIEAAVRMAALAQAEERDLEAPLVWAAGEGWHPGVVGIAASRLKEHSNRPSIVIGFDGDEGKGSGRSIAGVDLGNAIQRLAQEGLLQKGGGHKMAAGLSLTRAQLEPAMTRLSELLAQQGADQQGAADLALDGILMPGAATLNLIHDLDRAGPFGQGARAPRFAFPDLRVAYSKPVGQGHLKFTLTDGSPNRLDAIAFGAAENGISAAVAQAAGQPLHVAGKLEINSWQGRESPQLRIEDIAVP